MRDPVDNPIQTRRLAVYYQESHGRCSTLVYLPAALGDEAAPREYKEIARQMLTEDLDDVRATVDRLTGLAVLGRDRGETGIELVARRLAAHVLPAGLLERCLGPSLHPRFDIGPDLAAAIPWELFETGGPSCNCAVPRLDPPVIGQTCPQCGQPFGNRIRQLALTYHLTHLIPGNSAARRGGRTFLLIHDPTGDLCERDPTPDHVCATHVAVLSDLIRQAGFQVDLLSGEHATRAQFREALRHPDVAGLYFFGHGCMPREGNEGFLRLADGEMVASAIEELELAIPFVFLNACEGAAAGRDWDLDRRNRNVACAFARGPGRAVIAPLWPVVNVQAAQTALDVFRGALDAQPLAKALRQAREHSHAAYVAGAPHLAWMAYRYFGNPNHSMVDRPLPLDVHEARHPSIGLAPEARDLTGHLDVETFAFDLDGILLRAAKRRNLHDRTRVTVTDLIAGIVRKGDLTRLLLRSLGCDPDELYQRILGKKEEVPGSSKQGARIQQASKPAAATPSRVGGGGDTHSAWVLRTSEQFAPGAWRVLTTASAIPALAVSPPKHAPVPESDLLQRLVQESAWSDHEDLGLPAAAAVQGLLQQKLADREIDANGAVPLEDLDPLARDVIHSAHRLAQHRGLFPIPHRLVLAAMLCQSGSFAARLCRRLGGDPEALLLLMLAATESEADTSGENAGLVFGLTPEACDRIITPMLREARRMTPAGAPLAEATVVHAFCTVADPSFKQAVRSALPTVNLDDWPSLTAGILKLTNSLDDAAWKVIKAARDLTDNRGVRDIPNRLFLAAFLSRPDAPASRALRLPDKVRLALYTLLLESLPARNTGRLPLDTNACARVVGPAIQRARAQAAGSPVDEWGLFKAFCDVMEPQLKVVLRSLPWNLDLDRLPTNPSADLTASDPGAGVSASVPANRETSPATPPPPAMGSCDSPALADSDPPDHRLDAYALALLAEAGRLALAQRATTVRTPHLWAALLAHEDDPLGRFLRRHSIAPDNVQAAVLRLTALPPGFEPSRGPKLITAGQNVLQTLKLARDIASQAGRQSVEPSDILRALLADTSHPVHHLLGDLGLNLSALHRELTSCHPPPGPRPPMNPWFNN